MWLYIPSHSAPGSACSTSESNSGPVHEDAPRNPSVTWKGKPLPQPCSPRVLKSVRSLPRLSGLTSPPSTVDDSFVSWARAQTFCFPVSPASHTRLVGNTRETPTSEPSGLTSSESPRQPSLPLSFLRTSRSSLGYLGSASTRFDLWVSSSLRRSFRLPRNSGRSMSESEPLSSLPTPTASTFGSSNNGDPKDGRGEYATKGKPSLETMLRQLATPMARDFRSGKISGATHAKNARPLNEQVQALPPPTAGDAKGSGSRNKPGSSANYGVSLTDAIQRGGSSTIGSEGATRARSGALQLNPRFSEWMQGLPEGWVSIEPMNSEQSGTGALQSWWRQHSTYWWGNGSDDE